MRVVIGFCLVLLLAAGCGPGSSPPATGDVPAGLDQATWNYVSVREGTTSFGVGTSPQYPNIFRVRVYTGSASDPRRMVQAIRRRYDCTRLATVRVAPNRREGVFRGAFCRPAPFYR